MYKTALEHPNKIYQFKIIEKEQITHDTIKFIFELPSENHVLGTKSGQHVFFIANIKSNEVWRKYTPTSLENETGKFEIVIKIYRSTKQYPEGGIMTKYLDTLSVGDFIKMQGPIGRCAYKHNGIFELIYKNGYNVTPMITKKVKNLGMIAGGSGIVPLYQIAKTICLDETDQTQIKLISSNHTEQDIILKNELDTLAKTYPNKIKVWYTITQSTTKPANWSFSLGYINEEMFLQHLPKPSDSECLIMFCGPKGMNSAASNILEKLKYKADMIYRY